VLDRALADAGIERKKSHVTNAVKHFKFVRRGKIRLHQKPDASEIAACNRWLAQERAVIKPLLIVALGATALRGVFGKAMPIGRNRGRVMPLDDRSRWLITIHPSCLLRMQEQDKEREYEVFVADLVVAAKFLRSAQKTQ
jgi:uracil-DNA glycosylase